MDKLKYQDELISKIIDDPQIDNQKQFLNKLIEGVGVKPQSLVPIEYSNVYGGMQNHGESYDQSDNNQNTLGTAGSLYGFSVTEDNRKPKM